MGRDRRGPELESGVEFVADLNAQAPDMVDLLSYLPLVAALALIAMPAFAQLSNRVQERVRGVGLLVFGSYVARDTPRQRQRTQLIRSAHIDVLYRVYASETLVYATLAAMGGSVVGLYAIGAGLEVLAVPADTIRESLPAQMEFLAEGLSLPQLTVGELFVLFVVSGATFGTAAGVLMYAYRWWLPGRIADRREVRIDESLPRTVAFMFALSRGGMSHEELIRILSRNSQYFGEAAQEFIISLRDMDVSNTDFLTATSRLARTSPSSEFANFAEDLTNVLQTGRSMSEYFREEYEQYQSEKESRQERILEQIAALAEGYVALLVAGPLFLITILVIIGLLVGGTLTPLRVFVYLILPVVSVGFMLYVGDLAAGLGIDIDVDDFDLAAGSVPGSSSDEGTVAFDGGVGSASAALGDAARTRANYERLAMYNRLRDLREKLSAPVRTAIQSPLTVLYVMTPLATLYFLGGAYLVFLNEGGLPLRSLDDYVVQGALIVLVPLALAQYLHDDRLDRIERALPDFIDRLADRAGAGMTLTRAIRDIEPTSVPGLEREIERLAADIDWGARTAEALRRFAERTQSVFVVRAVILMTNAMHASGDIAPVLRIAADEAQLDRRLDRRRREELLIYRLIIYMSFFIFIGIVAALVLLFIPSIPSTGGLVGGGLSGGTGSVPGVGGVGGGGSGGGSGGGGVDRAAYSLILFHSAMIQGVVAGLVAGKMSEGTVRAGVKHAALMLTIAYVATLVLGQLA